ncbi:hypothetical protein [Spirosoma endophyticum]|uniref:Nucleotide-diphospho-sugar transferase n=1 Tax=Spirosoma endophyticum TaxID=662367 RepID=A0A1I1TAS9_9BACT|nr:hypothetical protein [Spirosoma endophyticum]SFD55696.1 hypothetical protein SAMN05216167_105405 [Spirosoma endophyticum]
MEINTSFDVPVLLVMFNRPTLALQVFERIREARPSTLYLAVDGPRLNHPTDNEAVLACRDIENRVDWPCAIKTLYRTENLGCKKAVSSAITWFFEQVEAGIILEDDCLPDLTFFEFCRILLHKYTHEHKVMHIGGANLYGGHKWGGETFFFSNIPHIWGWATWRRAWQHYDVNMNSYPEFMRSEEIKNVITYSPSVSYWQTAFYGTYSGNIDTWDYQWVFAIWKNKGLSIIPNQNLISNIGFGESATHTLSNSEFANLGTIPLETKRIIFPKAITLNKEAVHYALARFYAPSSWWNKLRSIKNYFIGYKSYI